MKEINEERKLIKEIKGNKKEGKRKGRKVERKCRCHYNHQRLYDPDTCRHYN